VDVDRRQRPRIIEHDARTVRQQEHRTREAGQGRIARIELPIAIHAEMHAHRASIR
jgi:hypothetical protein